mmetsp:Transcript_15017/g.32775  ORF Transcript_15017/g.32775 Transcript_15017/m.32775 type:complete len:325 (+) Transcript_15017:273-1247(+)
MLDLSASGSNEDIDIFCAFDSRLLLHEVKHFKDGGTVEVRHAHRVKLNKTNTWGGHLQWSMMTKLAEKITSIANEHNIYCNILSSPLLPVHDIRPSLKSTITLRLLNDAVGVKNIVGSFKFDIMSHLGERCLKPINLIIMLMYPYEDRPCLTAEDWGWAVVNSFDIDVCKAFIPMNVAPAQLQLVADRLFSDGVYSERIADSVAEYELTPSLPYKVSPLEDADIFVTEDCRQGMLRGKFNLVMRMGETPLGTIARIRKYEQKGYEMASFKCSSMLSSSYAELMMNRIDFYVSVKQGIAQCSIKYRHVLPMMESMQYDYEQAAEQ